MEKDRHDPHAPYNEGMITFRQDLQRESKDRMKVIRNAIGRRTITPDQLLRMVCDDHNLLDAGEIEKCLIDTPPILNKAGLEKGGIDQAFIDMLGRPSEDVLPGAGYIEHIDEGTTEVYLWGIPGSGKTCVLGSVLAAASDGQTVSSISQEECQGGLYMDILMQIFKRHGHYCYLPGRTVPDANFEIRTLIEDLKGKAHHISFIDMAGELFCALYCQGKAGYDAWLNDKHPKAIEEFENMLVNHRSTNPKYHFFIVEYGGEKRKFRGFDQDTYLEFAFRYLKEKKVLQHANDGLFIVLTKSDLARRDTPRGMTEDDYIIDYLEKNYSRLFGQLRSYCGHNKIFGGKLPDPIPFEIGELCFQNYCKMDLTMARVMLETIIDPPKKKGFLGRIFG